MRDGFWGGFRGDGGGGGKCRLVAAFGEVDPDGIGFAGAVVVFEKLAAEAADFDADDGVGLGIVAGLAGKDVNANDGFFEAGAATGEGFFDQIAEQLGHARAGGQLGAGQDAF